MMAITELSIQIAVGVILGICLIPVLYMCIGLIFLIIACIWNAVLAVVIWVWALFGGGE